MTRRLLCGLLAALLGLSAAPASAAERPRDPFFPRSGNAGYDVLRYQARLAYRPARGWLDGRVRIEARATRGLRRLSLDLVGLRVGAATVDGAPAAVRRGRDKLKLTPPRRLAPGEEFTLLIDYSGRPRSVIDPDGSREGWVRTDDGALAVGEPLGTPTWLPCNNSLADKAGFEFRLLVPRRLKAVANGRLLGVSRRHGRARFQWRAAQPMAPYLAVIAIGRGELLRGSAAGIPSWTLVDPRLRDGALPVLAKLPEAIRFLRRSFGPYPFDAAGSIVDPAPLGYALETQTRPIYTHIPDLATLVHETAHQWFGDSVGMRRWPEIWLNEGFATWSQWWYAGHHGGRGARQTFRRLYRVPASNRGFWEPPPGRPGNPKRLFASSVYVRGAMALEALRIEVGTATMLRILRRWAGEHRHGTATIDDFTALAERLAGRPLDELFRRWLYQRGKPPPVA